MKKSYIFIMMILNLVILTSCWNYKDVNKMRFVAGVAIDYDEEKDEFIVTSEVVKLIGGGERFGSTLFQSRGETVFEAVRDTIIKNARRLYWGHAKVVIISRDIANTRALTILDYMSRDAEFRDDIWIVISGEKTANEILEKTYEKREDITSFHIDDTLKNEKSISTFHAVPTWRFIKDMYAKGISPTLPIVKVAEKNGEKVPRVGGQTIIKGQKIAGNLDETETKAYLWVIDELKGGLLTVKTEVSGEHLEVTLEIFRNKTKIVPKKVEEKIVMKIDIETDVGIAEISGEANVIEKEGRKILTKDAEEDIKKQVENVIKKVQKEYESDIFKFSTEIKKKMPEEWRKIEPVWDEVFSDLKVEVNVKVNIRGSALTTEPVKVTE